jgi:hypothetical protein
MLRCLVRHARHCNGRMSTLDPFESVVTGGFAAARMRGYESDTFTITLAAAIFDSRRLSG